MNTTSERRGRDTHSPHQLFLATPRHCYTTSALAFAEDGVLRGAQGGLRSIFVNHLGKRMAKGLALAIQQDMNARDGVF